jgi:cytochrome c
VRRVWLVAVITVASVTGLGYTPPFGNPRATSARATGRVLEGANLSPAAKAVLVAKCADCHSNETRWPAYARVAPGSWLIERDVIEARKHMDLSSWELLSMENQQVLLSKISHAAKTGSMPPVQYVALHWGATLTATEVQTLSSLTHDSGLIEAASAVPGDASNGKLVFEKRCTGCHAMEEDREGPRLAGVYGRRAGSVPGFTYSDGLKNSGLIWTDAKLEKWLSGPDQLVPDTLMDFYVPKAAERRDLIAYFKSGQ